MQRMFARDELALHERLAARERVIGEHALAERVDRVNRCEIDFGDRATKTCRELCGLFGFATFAQDLRGDRFRRIFASARRIERVVIEHRERCRAAELMTQTLAQLLGRGDRIGDRENVLHRQCALDDEPRMQQRERKRLARTCARLDAMRAFERPVDQRRARRGHAASFVASMPSNASNSVRVTARKRTIACSSANGIAPRSASAVAASAPSP